MVRELTALRVRPVPCPKCGAPMPLLAGSVRTVRGGWWYERQCGECLHRVDCYKPRREAL